MARNLSEVMGVGPPPKQETVRPPDPEWGDLELPGFLRTFYATNKEFLIPPGAEIGNENRLGEIQRALAQAIIDMRAAKEAAEAEEVAVQERSRRSLAGRLRRQKGQPRSGGAEGATAEEDEERLTMTQRITGLERTHEFFQNVLPKLSPSHLARPHLYRAGNLMLLLCTTENTMGDWMVGYNQAQRDDEAAFVRGSFPRAQHPSAST